jgi:hypothetical protein
MIGLLTRIAIALTAGVLLLIVMICAFVTEAVVDLMRRRPTTHLRRNRAFAAQSYPEGIEEAQL